MSRHHPITWQSKYADHVNDEIEAILASLSDVTDFCDLVKDPLAGVGRGVDVVRRSKPWYLLPLIVCEAICGHYEHAIPASAALQLFIAAGEVFDDIEKFRKDFISLKSHVRINREEYEKLKKRHLSTLPKGKAT